MSVWLTIPSARPPAEANPVLERWRQMGYKIALFCDSYADADAKIKDRHVSGLVYLGYAEAVNGLIAGVMETHADADWFVAAGDDTLPDPNHTADEIAAQCSKHFAELHAGPDAAAGVDLSVKSISAALRGLEMHTFGVMQPTGDRFGQSPHFHPAKDRGDGIACGCGYLLSHPVHTGGAYIDFVAGSAWIGREFARRVNNGNGPLWGKFTHMFVDQALQEAAESIGVFWQRRDLLQVHQHWSRTVGNACPPHLEKVNTQQHWDESKAEYERLKSDNFREYLAL